MARLGASKKKKSPRATDPSQLKKELKRVTEQLESRDRELEQRNAELREALEHQTQRLRCSASSAGRPLTCSRSSTPSSRAPPGFVGSMTGASPPRRKRYGSAGSFWSGTHYKPRDQCG